MTTENYVELGNALGGVRFSGQYDEDSAHLYELGEDGDAMLTAYSWMRARGRSVDDAIRHWQLPVNAARFRKFVRWLEGYKRDKQLIDFGDMLDLPRKSAPIDVAVIDEFQDLTPQQWRSARRMLGGASKWILAGDDDQSIYEWAGSCSSLDKIGGRKIVLEKSHRVPKTVHALANGITRRISRRIDKRWSPRNDDGVLKEYVNLDEVDPDDGSWFVLVRNRHQLRRAAHWLEDLGRPYSLDGQSVTDRPSVMAVRTYERLRAGAAVPRRDASAMLKFFPRVVRVDFDPDVDEVSWSDVPWPFSGEPTWLDICGHHLVMPDRDDMFVRRVRSKGESLSKTPRITLSTIHGVKGAEADHVLLMPDMSLRTRDALREKPDAEHRVWYVGATRARHSLLIARPRDRYFYEFL